jgi:uncharacterized protein YegL
MKFFKKNKLLFLVGLYLIVVLLAIPLTIILVKQPKETRSNAATDAVLSFTPATTQANTGSLIPLDVMIDPGTHAVSFITLDIIYDTTKLSVDPTNAFQVNAAVFPTIMEGPVFDTGRIQVKLSIGSDPTKAITAVSKIATITFQGIAATNGSEALVNFGSSAYVLSVSSTDSATDNVLGNVIPAQLTITGASLPTPTGGTGGIPTTIPTFSVPSTTPIVHASPTLIVPTDIPPQPTCTPLPAECQIDETLPICSQIPIGGYCTGAPTLAPTPFGQPTPTPIACGKIQPADVILVLDVSGSMKGEKMINALNSAKSFLALLKNDPTNKFGLVSFSTTSKLQQGLTDNTDSINQAINALKIESRTCVKCGLNEADKELDAHGRTDAKKIIILLTDGKANVGGDTQITAEQAALNVVKNSKTQSLTVYPIGIGKDVSPTFLQQLATGSNGVYYFAPTAVQINDQFSSIYKTISDNICKIPSPTFGGGSQLTLPPVNGGNFDPVTIILIILLFLPLLLLLAQLLI